MQVDMIQEAADAFMECGEFKKAKGVCRDYAPELEAYVDEKYKLHLKHHGDTKGVSGHDNKEQLFLVLSLRGK